MRTFILFPFYVATGLSLHLSRDLSSTPPTATLDAATVTGFNQGNLSKFLGVPFAQAPSVYLRRETMSAHSPCLRVGDLRFRAPQGILSYNGSINGTSYGAICPQQTVKFPISLSDIFGNVTVPSYVQSIIGGLLNSSSSAPPESEDCMFLYIPIFSVTDHF